MPGFQDSAFIVLLALLLFGPKKLPVLARQLGKLMADFRRASNEFRTQMEEELRISEQADRQKQIAAIEAAAPATPALEASTEPIPNPNTHTSRPPDPPSSPPPIPKHSKPRPSPSPPPATSAPCLPSTGPPIANTSLSPFLDSIRRGRFHHTGLPSPSTPLR